jgi:hypothetical protein
MTDVPIRVVVLPDLVAMLLLAEQDIMEVAEEEAARLTEGSLRTSWECLEWAKAHMLLHKVS